MGKKLLALMLSAMLSFYSAPALAWAEESAEANEPDAIAEASNDQGFDGGEETANPLSELIASEDPVDELSDQELPDPELVPSDDEVIPEQPFEQETPEVQDPEALDDPIAETDPMGVLELEGTDGLQSAEDAGNPEDPEDPEEAEDPEELQDEDEELLKEQSGEEDEIDYSTWDSRDFTYGSYSKLLYGCDYTRQFTMEGNVITGFSERGEQKLAQNTDLVLPSEDDQGETIIGVGECAFQGKGLTSVTFPTGMLVDYVDNVTYRVTERGNFIIAESAFANNDLTNVNLPNGVIAVLPNAFMYNSITTVTFPQTIWWIETQSFAHNQISQMNFPLTCYFMLEMHGMPFADNNITSVRIPNYTEVVNMYSFVFNPGMEPLPSNAPDKFKTNPYNDNSECGVVYMYASSPDLLEKDRIHHIDQTTNSTHSWVQKLVIDGSQFGGDESNVWTTSDFAYSGNTITGLSDSGIAKRAYLKDLIIPDKTPSNLPVKKIAASDNAQGGLFATAEEGFDTVTLPAQLTEVGDNAFRYCGATEVAYSPQLAKIGAYAFADNHLAAVSLPNTVTTMGEGAFANNPNLHSVKLSTAMKVIPENAFGSFAEGAWMQGLTSITIPDRVTTIGNAAFYGNNFSQITLPASVTTVGDFAFAGKQELDEADLQVPCAVALNEGLQTIGSYAFLNKVIAEVSLPTTVESLPAQDTDPFMKVRADGGEVPVTSVYVDNKTQYDDKGNFANTAYRYIYYTGVEWVAEDFTYGEMNLSSEVIKPIYGDALAGSVWAVTGFSDSGTQKVVQNTDLVLPSADPSGNKVQGVAPEAFKRQGITSIQWPAIEVVDESGEWSSDMANRGYFFVGASAFRNNELSNLALPEGVLAVGAYAFAGNAGLSKAILPESLSYLYNCAFGQCSLYQVEFPAATAYPTHIGTGAFMGNQLQSLRIPDNANTVIKDAFIRNTGMEPVTTGSANEQAGGVVYMYVDSTADLGAYVAYRSSASRPSNVQDLVVGQMPDEYTQWNAADFTSEGSVITGLTETGKRKLKIDPEMTIPDTTMAGEPVTVIGAGVLGSSTAGEDYVGDIGTFGYREANADGTYSVYMPQTVHLPDGLQAIEENAFSAYLDLEGGNHVGVSSIAFPATLTSIGSAAFQNAPLSGNLALPAGLTALGYAAFTTTADAQVKIGSVTTPSTLAAIPDMAFQNQGLTQVTIQDGVTSVGARAFAGCPIEQLQLPDTLTSIESFAFLNHQVADLRIPASVESVGDYAFQVLYEELDPMPTSLTLQEGLKGVGNRSFGGSGLASVVLPTSVEIVHEDAFMDSAETVKLKTAVPLDELPDGVVQQGSGHVVIYDSLAGTAWAAEDFTYSEDYATITGLTNAGKMKRWLNHNLILPETGPDGATPITAIGDAAFAIVLKSDTFSGDEYDPVAELTKFGVDSPYGFQTVKLPSGLTSIGVRAFENNAINVIDLASCPDLSRIEMHAFHGNKIVNLVVPDTVANMGEGAFSTNEIRNLTMSRNVTVIPDGAFSMNIRLEHIDIPDTVTEIGPMAFAGARLTELTIPASVTKIDRKAFHLHRLTELTIPGTVKELGDNAFEGTFKGQTLTNLTLEEGIESIGDGAFKEGLLVTVKLPSTLQTLGDKPFENNVGEQGTDHVVLLLSDNPNHLAFNEGAKFHRVALDISKAKVTVSPTRCYVGVAPKSVTVVCGGKTLKKGTDYTLNLVNNAKPGTATANVIGKGNYTGVAAKKYSVYWNTINKNFGAGGKVVLYDSVEPDGSITKGSLHQAPGKTVTFRTQPDKGYTLKTFNVKYNDPKTGKLITLTSGNGITRISGTGAPGTVSTYTFVMPDRDVTINATFGVNKRPITKSITGSGAKGSNLMLVGSDGKPAGQTADKVAPTMNPQVGAKVYFKSVPASGAKLTKFNITFKDSSGKVTKWTTGNGITKVSNGLYCFTMPNYNVTLNGEFTR